VPMPDAEGSDQERSQDLKPNLSAGKTRVNPRRNFLQAALALGIVLVTVGIASVTRSLLSPSESLPEPTGTATTTGGSGGTSSTTSAAFPRVKVGNLSDLAAGKSVSFNYPLVETPNLLVKLGEKAEGGVGPDGDIIAFSQICQHLGCIYGFVPTAQSPNCDNTYKAPSPVGYCCCHGSVFDLANGGKVVDGPSPRPAPQVVLDFDSSTGDVYAVGMLPPTIFGHNTGSDNVLYDLKGGTLVS
jgi:arsenite oxidase small subunit